MNFKGRYSLVFIVFVTFIVVLYVPLGNNEPKCKKCLDCSELLNEISALPNIQRDMVVMRSSEIGNKSFDELRLLRLKQILNEQRLEQPRPPEEPSLLSRERGNTVINCVTQSKVLQKYRQETHSKRAFSLIENGTRVKDENVTAIREKWLMHLRDNFDHDVEQLVALNVIVTQLKLHLAKESITVLDIFCGKVQNTIIEEVVRSRDDIHYTGIDTSVRVISANKRVAQSMGQNTRFYIHDVLHSGLNRQFDLVVVLNTDGFLNKKQIATLLYQVNQSKSRFMLVDFDLINHTVLTRFKNRVQNSLQSWNLGSEPNQFDLDFPFCINELKAGKVWSLWELPLFQVTTKT